MEEIKNNNDSNLLPNGISDEEIEEVPLYKKKRVFIPLMIILAGAVAAALYWYIGMAEYITTDDAYVDGDRVTVSSKILGRISELKVDEGDTVKKGQVLVRLDDSDFRAQREQATAQLDYAEKSLELAKVNLSKTQEDYKRARIQYKNSIIPKEQYDHAARAFEASNASQSIAVAQIESAKAQIGVIDTQLGNTIIAAPMDGVVAKRWALAGDVVQMAQPILSVYDLEHLWVTANLEETKYSHVKLNQKVEIEIDTFGGKKFEGKVIQLGSNTAAQFSLIPPNNASGNFTKVTQRIPIKISIEASELKADEKTPRFLPGMSAEIKIKIR